MKKRIRNSESSTKRKRQKWKYTKEAAKFRRCEFCHKKLNKDETLLCNKCYEDLVLGNNHPRWKK